MSSLRKLIDEDYAEFLRKKHSEGDSVNENNSLADLIIKKKRELRDAEERRLELERLFSNNLTRKNHPNRIDSIEELIFRLKEDSLSEKAKKEKLLREIDYSYKVPYKEPIPGRFVAEEDATEDAERAEFTGSQRRMVDTRHPAFNDPMFQFSDRFRDKIPKVVQEFLEKRALQERGKTMRDRLLMRLLEEVGYSSVPVSAVGPVAGFIKGMWPTPAYKSGGTIKRKK